MAEIDKNIRFHQVIETIKKFCIFNILIPAILQISSHHIMTNYCFRLVLRASKAFALTRDRHFGVFQAKVELRHLS